MVQNGEAGSVRADLVNRAEVVAAAEIGGAVEKAVAALHQPRLWIGAIDWGAAAVVQHLVASAVFVDLVDCPRVVGAADRSCSVDHSVGRLDKSKGALPV